MSFPRYPEYKPSGVEWLGDVPDHWKIVPLRHIADCLDGLRVPLNAEQRAARPGAVPYWGANCVVDHVDAALISEPVVLLGEDGAPFFDRSKSVAFYIDEPIWPNNHVHVLRPRGVIDGKHLAAVLNITEYARFIDGSTRDKLTQTAMNAIPIPLPPLPEQRAIAAFLDRETTKIDGLVAEQQQLIELLKEKRQAVISHAVTKGLDSKAPMKPSGVEWLGDVPAHWRVSKGRHLFRKLDLAPEGDDEIVTIFRDGQVTLRTNRRSDGFTLATLEVGYQRIRAGDLAIHGMDAFAGAIGVSDSTGKCTPEYVVLEPIDSSLQNEFFSSILRVMARRGYIEMICPSVRERAPRFRFEAFKDVLLPVPPPHEQREILSHIAAQSGLLSDLGAESTRLIAILEERRCALISAAVTGQIDVRNAVTSEAA